MAKKTEKKKSKKETAAKKKPEAASRKKAEEKERLAVKAKAKAAAAVKKPKKAFRTKGKERKTLGAAGEAMAADFLERSGYAIQDKNYKTKLGEVDIVAKDNKYLVFVEVKSRRSRAFGDVREAVDSRKKDKLRKVAAAYLRDKKLKDVDCRFDVVSIMMEQGKTFPDIHLIKNAFQ